MKIAFVTMVKDEEDIIYHNLYYHYAIGIRDFYILENGSKDRTAYLLHKFKEERSDCFVYIQHDPSLEYWQYIRINNLANLAYTHGCRWILPVDADEFLFENGNPNFNINSWLEPYYEAGDYVELLWWYYRVRPDSDENEPNPIRRMAQRDKVQVSALTKIIVKWRHGMEICQGNHELHSKRAYTKINCSTLYMAHYSCRGFKHAKRKVINLGLAYLPIRNTFFHESVTNYERFLSEGDSFIQSKLNYEYTFESEPNNQILDTLNKVYSDLNMDTNRIPY